MLRSAGFIVPANPSTPSDRPIAYSLPSTARPTRPFDQQHCHGQSAVTLGHRHSNQSDRVALIPTSNHDAVALENGRPAAQSSPSQAASSFVLASMPIPHQPGITQPDQRASECLTSPASLLHANPIALSPRLNGSAPVVAPLDHDTIQCLPSSLRSRTSTTAEGDEGPPSILANVELADGPRITLAFHDLVYTVPVRTVNNRHGNGRDRSEVVNGLSADPEAPASPAKATSKWWRFGNRGVGNGSGGKVVLHKISGEFQPGQMVGILGPSGSGKTSLLNILAGLPSTGQVSGNVMLNNQSLAPAEMRSVVGFVFQDDLILETMTVTEALAMSLRLRNPPMSKEEEHKRIELAIDLLGLNDARDTLIGSAMQKGISGGERKRVAIGMELMARPAVVLLDECTTGLDSYTAFSVCSLLHKLAHRQGKTIVCTLHQPASDIVQVLDIIMILVKGKLLYHGPTNEMVPYFSRLNFQCPQYTNPPDYIFMSVINQRGGCEHLLHQAFLPPSPPSEHNGSIQLDKLAKYYPPFSQQIRYLSWRAWHNAIRNRLMLRAHLGQVVILGVLIGLIYLNIEGSASGPALSQSISGVMFFVATNMLFGGAMPVLSIFAVERPVFLREYLQGYYGVLAYYSSRTLVELPFQVLFPLVFACISYWLVLFSASVPEFLVYCMFLTLLGLVGSAFGICMASLFEDLGVSLAVVPVLLLPLMLFGGLLVNNASSPKWLSWLEWVSPVQYAFTGLMENYWRGRIVEGVVGNEHLDQIGVSARFGVFLNAIFLVILWAAYTILGYFGLRRIAYKAAGRKRRRPNFFGAQSRNRVHAFGRNGGPKHSSGHVKNDHRLDDFAPDPLSCDAHVSPQEGGLVHQGMDQAGHGNTADRVALMGAAVPLGHGTGMMGIQE